MKKTLLLAVSGGIAAVKVPVILARIKKAWPDLELEVMRTGSAGNFVSDKEITSITGKPVHSELFSIGYSPAETLKTRAVDHIRLADSASLIVVIPTSANTLAKLANGSADNFVTTTVLAATCPILMFPSMNCHMWTNPAVQANLELLRSRGMTVVEPAEGTLACGYEGTGKLPPVETVVKEVLFALNKGTSMADKTILITAGGTKEPLDTVRYIANRSSGKMGAAIAEEAARRGAKILYLKSLEASIPRGRSITIETFETAHDLSQLLQKAGSAHKVNVVMHAAAVADFTVERKQEEPETILETKLSSEVPHLMTLVPQSKLVTVLRRDFPQAYLVAFKAESLQSLIPKATQLLQKNDLDLVVANPIDIPNQGFGSEYNEAYLLTKEISNQQLKPLHIQKTSKRELAQRILDQIKL